MYNNVMEGLIPLENVMRDRQQVSSCMLLIHTRTVYRPCIHNCDDDSFPQSERMRFGHDYSDEESEFAYNQPSQLMATELATQRKTRNEKLPRFAKVQALSSG